MTDTLKRLHEYGPISAYEPADWHDVPKGYYAIPVGDWERFRDDCGPDDEPAPVLDLLGYALFERTTLREIKTGRKAGRSIGRDGITAGSKILAEGVTEYGGRTPWQRLTEEIRDEKFSCEHECRHDGDGSRPCNCVAFCHGTRGLNYEGFWKAVPDQREAYARHAAAVMLDGIRNHDDIYRRLYGQLTGSCGHCGRTLTDAKSKLIGIGPDCRGYR